MRNNAGSTRREMLGLATTGLLGACCQAGTSPAVVPDIAELGYAQVRLTSGPARRQSEENHDFLLRLNEDSLLRPFRVREGLPAPGPEMGGWYSTYAFAPAATFGQWVSALSRCYAATGDQATRDKTIRLVRGYAATIDPSGKFFLDNRFPSYIYDKLVLGLIDAHTYAHDPAALEILKRTTVAALPHLPPKAFARQETEVRHNEDFTRHCWDESYTLPENLFLAWQRTGDRQYLDLAKRLVFDEFFDPLARGENVLPGKHAYSHVNALSSAAQAYLTLGDGKYFKAAVNGFAMVRAQSYATGGWGPDEHFFVPGSGKLGESLTSTHNTFETPCGAYAHCKITRYLLRMTKDSRYGDSMERVLYNTVLGAKPIQPNGSSFYYSDYNFRARKFFHPDKWPCCSGTLPQVAADHRINIYFQDQAGLYVNLYMPSTVSWKQASASCSLSQTTRYPYERHIQFQVGAETPTIFSVRLRIPEWATSANVRVNGRLIGVKPRGGTFAEVRRQWKPGDTIELELPMALRLETVDPQHPNTVALLRGPLALMPIDYDPARKLSRSDLLTARLQSEHAWTIAGLKLKPFMDLQDESYSLYMQVQT